MIRKKR